MSMPDPTPLDPLADARAQAVRRILELRGEAPGADTVDLRALIARTSEANATARELTAVLPTRIEAAVGRALADDQAGIGQRIDDVRSTTDEIADTVARVEQDLVSERLGRIEDLEALVALISTGIAAIRSDLGQLNARVAELAARVEQPAKAPEDPPPATPAPPAGRHAYRSLFARTEPRAQHAAEPADESASDTTAERSV
jgi:predicted transcriptional regulator